MLCTPFNSLNIILKVQKMGKQKSLLGKDTMKHHSATKKTCSKKGTHNFEDVNSLSCFKQEKSHDIDDKFNLLKSELQSLFFNPKAEISSNVSRNQTITNSDGHKRLQHAAVTPKSPKFSEWLSETIDKMDAKSPNTSGSDKLDSTESLASTGHLGFKSKYNMTLLPKYKVERLLYKSFQLKNLGIYVLSSSDESEAEQSKSSRVRKHKRRQSSRHVSSFPRRSLKRKRPSLNNEIEIINLDSTSRNDEPKILDYVDLVTSYDWSEPFNTSSVSDNSDLEIIEDNEVDYKMEKQNKKNVDGKGNDHLVNSVPSDSTINSQASNSDKNFASLASPAGKKAWECPICFESSQGQTIVATQCGHIFCKACLQKHNTTQGKICPTCRFNLTNKPLITLFNL